jgi:uncharacterized protein YjbJ (UPF0337 family)
MDSGLLMIQGDLYRWQARREKEEVMKTSTQDKVEGALHEIKGKVKEVAGKVTDNPKLTTEGQAETLVGKVQTKVGQAKKVFEK